MATETAYMNTTGTIQNGCIFRKITETFDTDDLRPVLYVLRQKALSLNTCFIVRKVKAKE